MRKADADPAVLAQVLAGVFPDTRYLTFQRTAAGVSTPVYHVQADDRTYYLRLAESAEASLAPEAHAHRLLVARAVHVPSVMYFDPFNTALGRSLMITSAIPGTPVDKRTTLAQQRTILRAAGRDLAQINSVSVAGFGWIDRTRGALDDLQAEYRTSREFVAASLDDHLSRLRDTGVLSGKTVEMILANLSRGEEDEAGSEPAWLAHGDFDITHIFQTDGRFSGVIDFGEIRGTDRYYDLGHFRLHDGERISEQLLTHLLEGYSEVTPLPPDYERRITCAAIVIGVSGLGRIVRRHPAKFRSMSYYQWLSQKLPTLLG